MPGTTISKSTRAKPASPISCATPHPGAVANTVAGAAHRMLATQTATLSHKPYRLYANSPAAPMRPSAPSAALR
jgi:hypothetical protein